MDGCMVAGVVEFTLAELLDVNVASAGVEELLEVSVGQG